MHNCAIGNSGPSQLPWLISGAGGRHHGSFRMIRAFIFAFLILPIVVVRGGETNVAAKIAGLFQNYPQGCLVIYDQGKDRWFRHNPERCGQRFIPASTFKIPNSLVLLETGTASGPDHRLKWDGVKRGISAWNRDHTLRSAVAKSAVWYFERMADEVAAEKMTGSLKSSGYGNARPTGSRPFWIKGDLRISAVEQIEFLRKLCLDKLPFQKKHQRTVRAMIRLNENGLHGKTGWARPQGLNLGWFVGWLEAGDNAHFFALNIESRNSDGFGAARREIVERALRIFGESSK